MKNVKTLLLGLVLIISTPAFAEGQSVILECEYTGDINERSWNKSRNLTSAIILIETTGPQNIYRFNKETLEFSMVSSGCADVAINKVFCALPHKYQTFIDRGTLEVFSRSETPTLLGQCSFVREEDMKSYIDTLRKSMSEKNKF